MWGCWLVITFVAFSAGRYLNSYYDAALLPAIAAIVGLGISVVLRSRLNVRRTAALVAGVVASSGYAAYLLHGGSDVPGWLIPALTATTIVAIIGLVLLLRSRNAVIVTSTAVLTLAALLLAPATASATSVTRQLGPFDSPFEPHSVTTVTQGLSHNLKTHIASGERLRAIGQLRLSTETSGLAATTILFSGREVLPIGGFTGAVPFPTLIQLQNDVATRRLDFFILATSPQTPDPRLDWIRSTCKLSGSAGSEGSVTLGQYLCNPDS